MGMGQGVVTGIGYGGITCVLQTQFSSLFIDQRGTRKVYCRHVSDNENDILHYVDNKILIHRVEKKEPIHCLAFTDSIILLKTS